MRGSQAPRPEQWAILRRLRSASCPVDLEHLPPVRHPIRVGCEASPCGFHLFPIAGGAALVLPLRIVAQSAFTLCRLHLWGDWVKKEISWLTRCDRHGQYCFHEYRGEYSLLFSFEEVLNYRFRPTIELKAGSTLRGLAIGFLPDLAPFEKEEKLAAMICLEDVLGDQYPFNIVLDYGCEPRECKYTVRPTPLGEEVI
jgi:hypothetical protein